MWGGPCPAGPSGKLGPWRTGLNWPRCATPRRLNKTAAKGKSDRLFWSRVTAEETEDGRWTRLGEIRRVAATECWKGKGPLEVPSVRVARGPDGTRGFVLWRSSGTTRGRDYKRQIVSGARMCTEWMCSDFALGLMAISLGALLLLSLPWLCKTR